MNTQKTFKVITLGCSKNTVDSEYLIRQLKLNKVKVLWETHEELPENIIINTCGFIEDAKMESIDTIEYYLQLKHTGKIKRVYITGCLSQRYKEIFKQEYPDADGIYGVNEYKKLINDLHFQYFPAHLKEREITTGPVTAFLKIAEGCNRKCSFCAIPHIRGNHKSKPIEDLIDEAKFLATKGIKELILISQDLNYYGVDIYKSHKLPELVKRLAELNLFKWIRLQYLHPAGFPLELLDIMQQYPQVCNYIDIPIQHISDKMLQIMNRGITRKQTIDLLNLIRKKLPDASIRTTVLVGHPGETYKEYKELKDFIKEFKFHKLGGFTYSHEDHTPAFDKYNDEVSKIAKTKRLNAIMESQMEIATYWNEQLIGKTLQVLIEAQDNDNIYIGRTEYDSPEVDNEVIVKSTEKLTMGEWYSVKITSASAYHIEGTKI